MGKGGKGNYGWLLRVDINESRFVAACTATCLEDDVEQNKIKMNNEG